MTDKQANSGLCFVCGVDNHNGLQMKFYEHSPGEVHAEIIVPEHFRGYPGVVHGGIIAAMLDEVAGRTFMGDGIPRFMVTARLAVRYRRPVPVNKLLVLKGHAGEDKGKVAFATGEIYDENGEILAEAELVLSNVPEDIQQSMAVETETWEIFPDEE